MGGSVPFTHFICPTYWLHPQPSRCPTQAIRSTLLKGDEVGLHVHCWRTLVQAAGVKFLSTPDYASAAYMSKAFEDLLARAQTSTTPLFFNIGCHQEGAGRWKRPLIDFCHERRRELSSDAVVVTTVSKAAKVARREIGGCGSTQRC